MNSTLWLQSGKTAELVHTIYLSIYRSIYSMFKYVVFVTNPLLNNKSFHVSNQIFKLLT